MTHRNASAVAQVQLDAYNAKDIGAGVTR